MGLTIEHCQQQSNSLEHQTSILAICLCTSA
ncbi:hypothetical protein AYI69_g7356, partial [Smittium culicis]